MGTIPIIEHSVLDHLYQDIPVIFVDNLEKITIQEVLKKFGDVESFAHEYDLREPKCRKDHFCLLARLY
jgi:hypothetical protein